MQRAVSSTYLSTISLFGNQSPCIESLDLIGNPEPMQN